jgi:hypothetical protein
MPTYLYIHAEETGTPRHRFRSGYELRGMDYELSREVNHKGEVISDLAGGRIRAVLSGFGDEQMFRWLFRPDIEENGEIVTVDANERVIEKFNFAGAKATGYRLHFDARIKSSTVAVLTIEAKEITTNNEVSYKRR